MELARQCELRGCSGSTMISWIPSVHAVPGRRLKLKDGDGVQTPVMTVVRAYGTRPMAEVRERAHDWTRTRKASDI